MDQSDTQVLEILNDFSLNGIRDCALSDQSKSGMTRLCACFHDEFSDVACASDYQNLAFVSHFGVSFCAKKREVFTRTGSRREGADQRRRNGWKVLWNIQQFMDELAVWSYKNGPVVVHICLLKTETFFFSSEFYSSNGCCNF